MSRSEALSLEVEDEGHATRADLIAASVKQAVMEHRLEPGTRLSEDQIGALFGVSRTIARAALQKLAHDHIVTMAKNRGASVASPSVADARNLFEARQALEGLIVRRAAARMTTGDADRLGDLIQRGNMALEAADRGLAIRLSGEFHEEVAAVADQPILRSFLADLVSRSSLVIALYGRSRFSDCGGDEHRGLLAALAARDEDRAAVLMRAHLAHIEADLDLVEPVRSTTPLKQALFARIVRGEAGAASPAGPARLKL